MVQISIAAAIAAQFLAAAPALAMEPQLAEVSSVTAPSTLKPATVAQPLTTEAVVSADTSANPRLSAPAPVAGAGPAQLKQTSNEPTKSKEQPVRAGIVGGILSVLFATVGI